MSENAGMVGKLVLLVGSMAAMIGRCASAGDDIVRIGARGFDEVAMYGDDAFRSGDDLVRNGDNVALLSKNNISDEAVATFDDVFLEISEQGADFLLEEEDSEEDLPTNLKEKSLLNSFPLDSIETLFFGTYRAKRYEFNDATRKGFLELLAQSQPREKPDVLDGKSMLLRVSGPSYFELLIGANWLGIGRNAGNYEYYKYYTLHPSYAKVFLGKECQ